MIKALRIHQQGIKLAFAGRMAYRADFIISSSIMLAGDLIIPLATYLVYRSGASFPGWSLYEVLLIQGIFMFSKGISFSLFYGIIWSTLSSVREGTFDLVLLKPHPALHITMSTSFNCDELGKLLGGATLTGISLAHLPSASPARYAFFILLLLMSIMVLLSFAVIMSAMVFKWVGNSRVYEIFDSVTMFGQYPVTIFSRSFASLLTWLIPVSMIAFIPASVLLGKPYIGIIHAVMTSLIFLILSLALWHAMKNKYTSAGG